MDKVLIKVEPRTVYGVTKLYPANINAEILAKIAGTKTISAENLALGVALGLEVEIVISNAAAVGEFGKAVDQVTKLVDRMKLDAFSDEYQGG